MTTITQHGGEPTFTRVVDLFNAEKIGAPFKVVLHNAVEVTFDKLTDEVVEYFIPDLDGLLRVIAQSRVLHPRKLCGADIKFLRKALSIKAKDLAKAIDITPEHLSKCENGVYPVSPASEKLLRMFVFKTALKLLPTPKSASTMIQEALDKIFERVEPIPAHACGDELVLDFERGRPADQRADNDSEPRWEPPRKAA